MKKVSKKSLAKQVRRDVELKVARGVGKKAKKRLCARLGRGVRKLAVFSLITFVVTFCIYMFNLENKLLYYVVYPFLNRHYDSQTRDRRI